MKNPRAFPLTILATTLALPQEHQMVPGMTHEQHLAQMEKEAEVKKRGSVAMGFDQDKTTHHFYLTGDGGMEVATALLEKPMLPHADQEGLRNLTSKGISSSI